MTALNLTKDQATTAIIEALNEGDEDKETDVSRFQQVQEAFPEYFEQFLETNDIPFPVLQADWEAFSNSFKEHLPGIARHVDFKIIPARKHRLGHKANGQPKQAPKGKLLNETFTLSNVNILSAKPLITALAEVGFQPGTTGLWNRDITFRPPGQLDPRMGTGSATISILRTQASDKALYELYVTRTKSLHIQGQDSQATWHLHRSNLLAEIEEDSIVLEPPPFSLEAKRGFQFAIAMHRAGGVAETDFLDNIMFHLAAAGLWQITELHTLAKDTCTANLLTEKGQGRYICMCVSTQESKPKNDQGDCSRRNERSMKKRPNPATAHTQSRQRGAQTKFRSSALVPGRSTQFIANPCRWPQRPCPKRGYISAIFPTHCSEREGRSCRKQK